MTAFLPWQLDDARRLLADTDHLPHALLIHGLPGIGKREFALAMAATLLCEDQQDGLACGKCQGCVWMAGGTHPDFKQVRPEAVAAREGAALADDEAATGASEGSGAGAGVGTGAGTAKRKPSEELRIEQIRALESWYHQATHRGGWRVVVLYPAEALSVVSANALLKALEEPPANTLFLLASDAPDRLLPTLVSRCQKFALTLPGKDECVRWLTQNGVDKPQAWLAAAGGAPLAALQLAQSGQSACPDWATELMTSLAQGKAVDLPGLADNLAKGHASGWLATMQRLAVDLGFVSSGLPVRYFPGLEPAYTALVNASAQRAARTDQLTRLSNLSGTMNQHARLANHPLSAKLFAQQCLQTFCDALK